MTSCTKPLFDSGYKFRVPVDTNASVEVVVTRKSNRIRNFHCTVLQCPVVLTSLESSLVSTTLSILKMVKGRHGCDQFTKLLFESGY